MAANVMKFSGAIKVGSLASDPASPEVGMIYYNSTDGVFKKYEAAGWTTLSASEVSTADFRIDDSTDSTKKIAFDASGIATGTTRTIQMPDSNVDLGLVSTAIQSSEKGAANGVAELDANSLVPITQIPPAALERLVVVADQTARYALTTATVQNGDTVKQTDTGEMWFVIDDSNLGNSAGYAVYTAGTASSVPWSGVTGTPTTLAGYGITDYAAAAKAAAVSDSITNGITDVAPSQNAVFDALALKLANVVEDTTPQLGGDLDLNSKAVLGKLDRAAVASPTDFVEEEYFHALTLTASQTDAVESSLTFAHASFEGEEIVYKIKEATSNKVRIGTLKVVTNGTVVDIVDTFNETSDVGVTWTAAINGADCEIKYTTTTNNKTMRADVKRFKA